MCYSSCGDDIQQFASHSDNFTVRSRDVQAGRHDVGSRPVMLWRLTSADPRPRAPLNECAPPSTPLQSDRQDRRACRLEKARQACRLRLRRGDHQQPLRARGADVDLSGLLAAGGGSARHQIVENTLGCARRHHHANRRKLPALHAMDGAGAVPTRRSPG